jgi:hypothetical protein
MEQPAVVQERLEGLGELRIYRRPGPPEHAAFEVLRASDGRAWTLRAPWTARETLTTLLTSARDRLDAEEPPVFDNEGCAEIARAALGADDEILVVLLQQGEEKALAVWRRERARSGWSWTLDVVVVPERLGGELCRRLLEGLERLAQVKEPAGTRAHPRPILPTPSQPPSAMTRSISRL